MQGVIQAVYDLASLPKHVVAAPKVHLATVFLHAVFDEGLAVHGGVGDGRGLGGGLEGGLGYLGGGGVGGHGGAPFVVGWSNICYR